MKRKHQLSLLAPASFSVDGWSFDRTREGVSRGGRWRWFKGEKKVKSEKPVRVASTRCSHLEPSPPIKMTPFACTAPEKATVPGSRLCSRCKNELWGYLGNDTNITHTPPPRTPTPKLWSTGVARQGERQWVSAIFAGKRYAHRKKTSWISSIL